jgi:electron transport complex protein RnfD
MFLTLLALLFPAAGAVYLYGSRAILIITTSVAIAVLTEYLAKKLRGREFVMDGSALVTGLLFALILPPTVNLWMVTLGSIFAIAIVKEAFGGLGYYIFSPALSARAFLSLSFKTEMTTWIKPTGFGAARVITDFPLGQQLGWSLKLAERLPLYKGLFLGNVAGSIGETSIILILIGGAILLALKLIDWRIPLVYLVTVAILSLAVGLDPIFQLLAGGLMLSAFFAATDPVTSPITHRGRLIFALGCGLITVIIRRFGEVPEGTYYAIMFMNAFTPFIDRFVRVRPLGLQNGMMHAAK